MRTQTGKFATALRYLVSASAVAVTFVSIVAPGTVHAASWSDWINSRKRTTANSAPTIAGSPATVAIAGQAYRFRPSAADANSDTLSFSIANKPRWATFSVSSGTLSGTPTRAGSYADIRISVTDGKASASLAAFTLTVAAAASTPVPAPTPAPTPTPTPVNHAPTIAGTPVTSLNAGAAYTFQPSAADTDGNTLTFSIQNKPTWANFDFSSGRLSGTPAASDVGSYGNIQISVSDGKASASLAAFAVNVVQVSNGNVTVKWSAPTRNVDGSALTNLSGYKLYYGTSAQSLSKSVSIGAGMSAYVVENLSPSTWYFAVKAVNASGMESALSNTASKQIL